LCDAFQVPKTLSLQLLPFGKSDDDLGELTFGVGLFSVLSVPRGRCARVWRTVRVNSVLRVFFVFLLGFAFDPFWLEMVSDSPQQRADGPWVPGGKSACSPRTVCFLRFATGGSDRFNGRSAAQAGQSATTVRTVRGTLPDGPRGPSRTVRPAWPDGPPEAECFASWFDSSLPFSCLRVCFKESFLRLEVDP
jgi:hypothetical protein